MHQHTKKIRAKIFNFSTRQYYKINSLYTNENKEQYLKNNNITFLIVFSLILFIIGCSSPEEKANALYVDSVQIIQSANIIKTKSYSKTYDLYKVANKNINTIISKYPKTNISVEIISNRLKILNYSLNEFQKLDDLFKKWAEAEQDPLLCSLLIANTIDDKDGGKPLALNNIAKFYAATGQKEKAKEIFSKAMESFDKSENKYYKTLIYFADSFIEGGQKEEGMKILSAALKIAMWKIDDEFSKALMLRDIGRKYADIGQFTQAHKIANTISVSTKNGKIIKSWILNSIVKNYAKAGQFSQAFETIKAIDDASIKSDSLVDVAGLYIEIGQKEKAAPILSQALDIAMTINDKKSRIASFAVIAIQCAKAGLKDKLSQIISQSLESIKTIDDLCDKSDSLVNVAGVYIEIGQKEKAVPILSQALDIAMTINDRYCKTSALKSIAENYAKAGQFSQARETIKAIDDASYKSMALSYLADQYAKAGQFSQAFETIKAIDDAYDLSDALLNIATQYNKVRQKPNKEERAHLSDIIVGINPMEIKKIWE